MLSPQRRAARDGLPDLGANLIVRGLSKTFSGVRVLASVSFEVGFGQVHGLLGQNGSGKSTLIKILGGVHAPDAGGSVTLSGTDLPLPMPAGGFNRFGIAIVHQALGLVPSLSVTENLLVRRLVRQTNGLINWAAARREAASLFESYDLDLDPAAPVQSLAPVDRALLAIVRAFHEINDSAPARGGLLILDEPTPFLSHREVDRLFSLVRKAAQRGNSILFVSHDIDEVMDLTNRATILRNGKVSATLDTAHASKEDFISAIVGRTVRQAFQTGRTFTGEPSVKIDGLSGPGIETLSLDIHSGEIVGLAGLVGSGYDRVPYIAYGAGQAGEGTLSLGGARHELTTLTPQRAVDIGMVLVPGDRQGAGIAEGLSVAENLAIPMLGRSLGTWLVTNGGVANLSEDLIKRFDIRPADRGILMRSLSGGNQQKVVLAKWFQCNPKLILLDEPTQGVDVGAREQVFAMIRQAAQNGASVMCSSSDHEQLAVICDRVIIFSRGRVLKILSGADVSKDNISACCYASMDEKNG